MTLDSGTIERLNVPLDPSRVKVFEDGPARGAPYLEGHDVIRHANEVFGPGNWGYRPVGQPWVMESGNKNGKDYQVWACLVELTVRDCMPITEMGTNTRNGDGAAGLEMAAKGSLTDGLKRCLRTFGDRFGLILADKDGEHQREAIKAWEDYQQRQQRGGNSSTAERAPSASGGGSIPSLAPTQPAADVQVAHPNPPMPDWPDELPPDLLTLREVEAELARWNLGTGVIGAFVKQTKTPAPISPADFAAWAAGPDGRLYDAKRLVAMSLNYIKNNVPEGAFRDTAIEAIRKIRESQAVTA